MVHTAKMFSDWENGYTYILYIHSICYIEIMQFRRKRIFVFSSVPFCSIWNIKRLLTRTKPSPNAQNGKLNLTVSEWNLEYSIL